MGIAIALPGFNGLGRLVNRYPQFSFDESFSLPIFYNQGKMKKIYRLGVWLFCKMHHRIPLFLILRLPLHVRWFHIALEGLSFEKTLTKHFYKIWLRTFASVASSSIFLTISPCRQYSLTRTHLYSKSEKTSNSLADCSKNFKKESIEWIILARTSFRTFLFNSSLVVYTAQSPSPRKTF